MAERYDLPPERLGRWLERWQARVGDVAATEVGADVRFRAAAGAVLLCEPPFPPVLPAGSRPGYDPAPLLDHVARERRVGVLLVRLGGAAVGVFEGRRLVVSKVERRLVHGRHRAGGSSARRFERRRAGQARVALDAAADVVARLLVPEALRLDAVVGGGDRRALATVLEDRRLAPLLPLVCDRVVEVAEPRLDVLRASPDLWLATVVRPKG